MNFEEKSLRMVEIQTDVSLISFLSVIAVFFAGSLLPKFDSYDLSISIPISFLVISTFGFLFSALILSNASAKIHDISRGNVRYLVLSIYGVFSATNLFPQKL